MERGHYTINSYIRHIVNKLKLVIAFDMLFIIEG